MIIRRYYRGLKNFKNLYLPFSDSWVIYDNSQLPTTLVAEKNGSQSPMIYDEKVYKKIIEVDV